MSHDGGSTAGDHCTTLTVTDRCCGWTEIVPVLHSQSGSEFIGDELKRSCDAHGIRFTCSRPWHKNDNCTVESKNWTLVRRCPGYRRSDTEGQLADLRQLETLLARRANLLHPPWPCRRKSGQAAGSRRGTGLP